MRQYHDLLITGEITGEPFCPAAMQMHWTRLYLRETAPITGSSNERIHGHLLKPIRPIWKRSDLEVGLEIIITKCPLFYQRRLYKFFCFSFPPVKQFTLCGSNEGLEGRAHRLEGIFSFSLLICELQCGRPSICNGKAAFSLNDRRKKAATCP